MTTFIRIYLRYMMCGDLRQRFPALLPAQLEPAAREAWLPSSISNIKFFVLAFWPSSVKQFYNWA